MMICGGRHDNCDKNNDGDNKFEIEESYKLILKIFDFLHDKSYIDFMLR